jgi:hypothetical protein
MQNMLKHLFSRRRRQAPRNPAGLAERRVVRHEPAPMPRMRWY